jgi:hypothetical protein
MRLIFDHVKQYEKDAHPISKAFYNEYKKNGQVEFYLKTIIRDLLKETTQSKRAQSKREEKRYKDIFDCCDHITKVIIKIPTNLTFIGTILSLLSSKCRKDSRGCNYRRGMY